MRFENDNMLVLSRRNLMSLLAKLDGHPPDSACTIYKSFPSTDEDLDGQLRPARRVFFVRAEEDAEHYEKTEYSTPGVMHPDTENSIGFMGIYD